MKAGYSTREAAQKLGVSLVSLQRHVSSGRIPAPVLLRIGKGRVRLWTDRDVERARKAWRSIRPGPKPRKKK